VHDQISVKNDHLQGVKTPVAVARLKLAGSMVPSIDWLLYSFVRKEAVVSSQIEGTQATLWWICSCMKRPAGKTQSTIMKSGKSAIRNNSSIS
jgi:hypothetical protein